MKVEVYKSVSEDMWIYYCPKCGVVRRHTTQRLAFRWAQIHAEWEKRRLRRSSATSQTTATKSLIGSIRKELFVSPS